MQAVKLGHHKKAIDMMTRAIALAEHVVCNEQLIRLYLYRSFIKTKASKYVDAKSDAKRALSALRNRKMTESGLLYKDTALRALSLIHKAGSQADSFKAHVLFDSLMMELASGSKPELHFTIEPSTSSNALEQNIRRLKDLSLKQRATYLSLKPGDLFELRTRCRPVEHGLRMHQLWCANQAIHGDGTRDYKIEDLFKESIKEVKKMQRLLRPQPPPPPPPPKHDWRNELGGCSFYV